MFKFNSQIQLGAKLPEFSKEEIKNEPMLFSCGFEHARSNGGPLTTSFLATLPWSWRDAPDLIIDSRVHMLMKGWFPCIPGYHHDDVPRSRENGQPNYHNPEYHAEHCMALIGDCCPTEFAIGESEFPEISQNEKYYKVWHSLVEEKARIGELKKVSAPSNQLICFNCHTWHQGTRAQKDGWRFFIRATRNTNRKPTNELRRQVQVYLEAPMEGW